MDVRGKDACPNPAASALANVPVLGPTPVETEALMKHQRQKNQELPYLSEWSFRHSFNLPLGQKSGNCCSRAASGPYSLHSLGKRSSLWCHCQRAPGPCHHTPSPAEELNRTQTLHPGAAIHPEPLCKVWTKQPGDFSYYLPLNPYSSNT